MKQVLFFLVVLNVALLLEQEQRFMQPHLGTAAATKARAQSHTQDGGDCSTASVLNRSYA